MKKNSSHATTVSGEMSNFGNVPNNGKLEMIREISNENTSPSVTLKSDDGSSFTISQATNPGKQIPNSMDARPNLARQQIPVNSANIPSKQVIQGFDDDELMGLMDGDDYSVSHPESSNAWLSEEAKELEKLKALNQSILDMLDLYSGLY